VRRSLVVPSLLVVLTRAVLIVRRERVLRRRRSERIHMSLPRVSFMPRAAEEAFHRTERGRSSAGPARPAATANPPLSIGSTLQSPLLLLRHFSLLAQSYLQEHQEHNCAKTEGDQRDGEHFAGQPTN